MAFENLAAINRGPGIDTNLIAGIGQRYNRGLDQGQRNRLVQEQAQQQEQFRNILAEYVGPDQASMAQGGGAGNQLVPNAPPELPPEAINRLMAVDPERATQLASAQQQQQQVRQQQQQVKAREAVMRMQHVLEAPPGRAEAALRLAGRMPDGSDFLEMLVGQGLVSQADVDDGISDEEARRWAEMGVQTYEPMAGPQEQPRAAGLEGTFQALERRGVDVTPEMALELAQSSDSEVAALAAELGVQKSILDLERTRFELGQKEVDAEREGREREAQNAANERRALGGAERILQGWESLDTISQSAVARPGFAGQQRSTLASALSFIGMEDPQVASAAEQFQDVATISGAELITELGLDPTDTKFRAITEASLSLDKGEQTNRVQLQRLGRTVLDEADAGRINLPEDVESRFREIVEWEPSPREPTIDAPGAARRAGEAVSGATSRVSEAGRELFGSAKSTLSDVATRARTTGGRVSADTIRETSAQIDALRDQLPEPDFNRAKELVERGTEEGMLAARGILDSAQETAGGAAVRIDEIARMGRDRLLELSGDFEEMTEEQREAIAERLDELGL